MRRNWAKSNCWACGAKNRSMFSDPFGWGEDPIILDMDDGTRRRCFDDIGVCEPCKNRRAALKAKYDAEGTTYVPDGTPDPMRDDPMNGGPYDTFRLPAALVQLLQSS